MRIFGTRWFGWRGMGLLVTAIVCFRIESTRGEERDEPWRIVVLTGANFSIPASLLQDQAMRRTLVAGAHRRIEFYPEALETMRLFSGEYEPQFVAFLQKKYST